jgi:poly(A)-specific ribonuclease
LADNKQFQKRKTGQFNYLVCKQIGLRWIFEALSGGDLSGLDPKYLSIDQSEADVGDPALKLKAIKLELRTVIEALRIKRPIIIGHNLFMDLGFLYSTFVGNLPQDVHHFQAEIHEKFPLVFDTKYIATEGIDSNARQGLKDLLEPFKEVHEPLLLLHESHTSYGTSFSKAHEAGFDSKFDPPTPVGT